MNCERTSCLEGCLIFGIEIKASIFNETEPKKYQKVKKGFSWELVYVIFLSDYFSKRLISTPDSGKHGTRAEGAHQIGSLPSIQMVYIYFVRL